MKILNPNRNINYRLQKIIKNYNKFGKIIIGVDYDFTLVDSLTKELYSDVIELLQRGQREEILYCIWTANTNKTEVINTWEKCNLKWHYYNKSPINPENIKPHFNILLDDSAGLDEALKLFELFLIYLENK